MSDEWSGSPKQNGDQESAETRASDAGKTPTSSGNNGAPERNASCNTALKALELEHSAGRRDVEQQAKSESDGQYPSMGENGYSIPDPVGHATDAKRQDSPEISDEKKRAAAEKRSDSPEDTAKVKQTSPIVEMMRWKDNYCAGLWAFGPQDLESRLQACREEGSNYLPLPYFAQVSLVLPTEVGDPGPTRELFRSIVNLLQKHVPLSLREACLVANWSMATWFSDLLPFFPSLAITGSPSAADLLLRTLASICRRPLLLGELSPAVLRLLGTLRPKVTPTLLIREPRLSQRMAMWVESSNYRGYLVPLGRDLQHFYFPKGVYVGEHLKNPLTNSIRVHVGDAPSRPLYPPPTKDVTQNLQNRLLGYRFRGRDEVAENTFRVSGFQAEVCAVVEVLGTAIVGDPGLQRETIELFKERDEQFRVDRASSMHGFVLRAVLHYCHQANQQKVFVREVAAEANRFCREEGESLQISSENAGHVLKYLGLYSCRLGSEGRGLLLNKSTQSQAHRLAYAYDVLSSNASCLFCQKLVTSQTENVMQDPD